MLTLKIKVKMIFAAESHLISKPEFWSFRLLICLFDSLSQVKNSVTLRVKFQLQHMTLILTLNYEMQGVKFLNLDINFALK